MFGFYRGIKMTPKDRFFDVLFEIRCTLENVVEICTLQFITFTSKEPAMFGFKFGSKLTLRDRLFDTLYDFINIFEDAVAICTLQYVQANWTSWIFKFRKY